MSLSRAALERLPQQELAAVCQCAGNRRGLFSPPVAGLQWGVGAMGCALWRGPRLRDVLDLAGIGPDAVEIALYGADAPASEGPQAYVKSIPMDRARADTTLVALAMNGAPLPLANGFPARVVVAGWVGDYWMKHLAGIEIRSRRLDNVWMRSACRVPVGLFAASGFASQDTATSQPVTDIPVGALATSHTDGDRIRGPGFTLSGLAWDNGSGIRAVDVSITQGATWGIAMLGPIESDHAFRPWSIQLSSSPGPLRVWIRARANSGAMQPALAVVNPGGYLNNAVQTLDLVAA